jgi:hypothetical protein
MKRLTSTLLAMTMLASVPIIANAQVGTARVVQNGNTDIIFENAGKADLNVPQLKDFDDFAASHPDVVSRLGRNPELLNNNQFLSSHAELAQFVSQHPNFRNDFERNPGNYIRLAPGVWTRTEASRQ